MLFFFRQVLLRRKKVMRDNDCVDVISTKLKINSTKLYEFNLINIKSSLVVELNFFLSINLS